ncbi:MAG: hypothetical protein AAF467_03865 [Actinomycetota bacterium]
MGPMWLAHHHPDQYHERCLKVAGRPVCRRCASLYPLSFLVAGVSVVITAPWPAVVDLWLIWALSIPATIAYCGEALGLFGYSARWQAGTTLVAALAFGRALGYELLERGHPWFWSPLIVFGTMWFIATVLGNHQRTDAPVASDDQRAATASSSSASVL